jgi:hypothetical protein
MPEQKPTAPGNSVARWQVLLMGWGRWPPQQQHTSCSACGAACGSWYAERTDEVMATLLLAAVQVGLTSTQGKLSESGARGTVLTQRLDRQLGAPGFRRHLQTLCEKQPYAHVHIE